MLVVGGGGSSDATAEIWDPRSGAWSATASALKPLCLHRATLLLDGRVLVVDDLESSGHRFGPDVQVFDPGTGKWSGATYMLPWKWRHDEALVPLPDGTISSVAADGRVSRSAPAVELGSTRDVATRPIASHSWGGPIASWDSGWTTSAPQREPRSQEQSTALGGGRVLLTGGLVQATRSRRLIGLLWLPIAFLENRRCTGFCCAPLVPRFSRPPSPRRTELWDPSRKRWLSAGAMMRGRVGHSATHLPDGRVLVAGGPDASAEIWTPRN